MNKETPIITVFDLRHGIDHDDWELGLRVACALYMENHTSKENFLGILEFRHSMTVRNKLFISSVPKGE
jgi:hypothetical protein